MELDAATQQQIIDRFVQDEDFRNRVLDDPNKAFKENFGIDLPYQMRVVEDDTSFRLEPVIAEGAEGAELSDDQLDVAAGGFGFHIHFSLPHLPKPSDFIPKPSLNSFIPAPPGFGSFFKIK